MKNIGKFVAKLLSFFSLRLQLASQPKTHPMIEPKKSSPDGKRHGMELQGAPFKVQLYNF